MLFIFLLFYIIQLVYVSNLAKSKGHSYWDGLFVGAIFPFLSIIIVALFEKKEVYGKKFVVNNKVKMVPINFTYMETNSGLSYVIEELKLRKDKCFTVTFTKPQNLVDWEWTIRRCALMTKLLLILHKQMPKSISEFSIVYNSRIWGSMNEVSIRHDHLNYRFVIDTTIAFYSPGGINPSTNLYTEAQNLMSKLLQQMTDEFPKNHQSNILDIYYSIQKDNS
ncbi:hypothetical protein [Hymenobacter antarcticus]|uniref:hypothetical protein n=1 Tax=Hymenobacter antarcticus TaxID=486270 RepID=UPI0031EA3139